MSHETQKDTLLELKDYSITFKTPDGEVKAVSNMNLTVKRGERIAIVGESGSGKSQTFLGIMGLLAKNGKTTGQALLEGKDVLSLKPRELDQTGKPARRRDPAAQHPRCRQHLRSLSATHLCRRRRSCAEVRSAGKCRGIRRGGSTPPRRKADRTCRRRSPSDSGRRLGAARRRGRCALRPRPGGSRPRQWIQGSGGDARQRCARTRAGLQAGGDLARHLPARHARLDGAEPAQAESANAAYSGPDHQPRRGSSAWADPRRLRLHEQADDPGRPRQGTVAIEGLCTTAPQASAARGGQRGRASERHRPSRT